MLSLRSRVLGRLKCQDATFFWCSKITAEVSANEALPVTVGMKTAIIHTFGKNKRREKEERNLFGPNYINISLLLSQFHLRYFLMCVCCFTFGRLLFSIKKYETYVKILIVQGKVARFY